MREETSCQKETFLVRKCSKHSASFRILISFLYFINGVIFLNSGVLTTKIHCSNKFIVCRFPFAICWFASLNEPFQIPHAQKLIFFLIHYLMSVDTFNFLVILIDSILIYSTEWCISKIISLNIFKLLS